MTSRLAIAGLLAAATVAAGCTSTTNGTGVASPSVSAGGVTSPSASPSPPPTPVTRSASAPATASAPASTPPDTSGPSIHPAPATPVRTATVKAEDGVTYKISVWAEVRDKTCFDHAYGQVATFLTEHPCRGLERLLATTTVNGRAVGFAESFTSEAGTPRDLYGNAAKLKELELKDGTGSIDDLLRDGYRLPSGPTSVPSPDAFNCLGQDTGVTVWDVWYLDGPTPNNDPALITLTNDVFLAF